jgi:hypothetical protein
MLPLLAGLLLPGPAMLRAQHFVPVYQSVYQPMNIVINAADIGGLDLEAGDEIAVFDLNGSGQEICVGAVTLAGPVLPGTPLPMVASTDDPLTPEQDGFIDGNPIIFRIWDNSEALELVCVEPLYDPGFDQVFTSLGTALAGISGIYSPTASAGPDDTSCEDSPYTLSGSATNQQSVLWTTAGDGTFNNPAMLNAVYTPGPGDISGGSALLTLTAFAVSPCDDHATDDMLLSVQALPEADAGPDDMVCEDASYTLSGFAANQQSVLWTTSGDGTFDDPTLLNASYSPGSGDIGQGSVTLSLTAFAVAPCDDDATDSMLLEIQELPGAGAGDDGQVCESDPYTLNGSASNYTSVLWTSAGDGTFDDPTLLNATYTPGSGDISNGSAILTLTAEAIAPCGSDASDDMTLIIQQLPTTNAGPDDEICEGDTYTMNGAALNQASVLWTTAGDGSFDNPALLNAVYNPGAGDIANGSVLLTLTAFAIAPCGGDAVDDMLLLIQPAPEVPETPVGPTEVDLHYTTSSDYETQSANAETFQWFLSPGTAGSIAGNGNTATVNWNTSFHGYAYLKVLAVNQCGSQMSDSLEVFVFTSVGTDDHHAGLPALMISPNPGQGLFRLTISATEEEMQLAVFDAGGNPAYRDDIQGGSKSVVRKQIDLQHLPPGIYILRLYNGHMSISRKLIIR